MRVRDHKHAKRSRYPIACFFAAAFTSFTVYWAMILSALYRIVFKFGFYFSFKWSFQVLFTKHFFCFSFRCWCQWLQPWLKFYEIKVFFLSLPSDAVAIICSVWVLFFLGICLFLIQKVTSNPGTYKFKVFLKMFQKLLVSSMCLVVHWLYSIRFCFFGMPINV